MNYLNTVNIFIFVSTLFFQERIMKINCRKNVYFDIVHFSNGLVRQ